MKADHRSLAEALDRAQLAINQERIRVSQHGACSKTGPYACDEVEMLECAAEWWTETFPSPVAAPGEETSRD